MCSESPVAFTVFEHTERPRLVIDVDGAGKGRRTYELGLANLREFAVDLLSDGNMCADLAAAVDALRLREREALPRDQQVAIARLITYLWRASSVYEWRPSLRERGKNALRRANRWIERSLSSEKQEPVPANKALKGIKEIIARETHQYSCIKFYFTDYYIYVDIWHGERWTYRHQLGRKQTEFAEDFLHWWSINERDARLFAEEAWKWLQPEARSLCPLQRYELSTNLITAFTQDELSDEREEEALSWHYCCWLKQRWLAAEELHGVVPIEDAAIAWLNACYRCEPEYRAMSVEVDPEAEIRHVLFEDRRQSVDDHERSSQKRSALRVVLSWMKERGERLLCLGPPPSFPSYMRVLEQRRTLTRLAIWFMRRYNMAAALRVSLDMCARSWWLQRITIAILTGTVIGLCITADVQAVNPHLTPWVASGIAAVLSTLLLMVFSSTNCFFLFARLAGTVALGWLTLCTEENINLYKYAWSSSTDLYVSIVWCAIVPTAFVISSIMYIIYETNTLTSSRRVNPILPVFIAQWLFSISIGAIVCSLSDTEVFGIRLLCNAPIAVFIGIVLQALWEEKPITEPL